LCNVTDPSGAFLTPGSVIRDEKNPVQAYVINIPDPKKCQCVEIASLNTVKEKYFKL
jgi:hypothetical protein